MSQRNEGSTGHAGRVVRTLLDRYGRTYGEQIGIDIAAGGKSAVFLWLCATVLLSYRVRADVAVSAARALLKQDWTTPERLIAAPPEECIRTLNNAGYARYDETASHTLTDLSSMLIGRYAGDLGNLRKHANSNPSEERRLLQELKGVGAVGVDVFFREAQSAWDELYPYADKRALHAAKKLGLGSTAAHLAGFVEKRDFPRLAAALVRTDLESDYEAVRQTAEQLAHA